MNVLNNSQLLATNRRVEDLICRKEFICEDHYLPLFTLQTEVVIYFAQLQLLASDQVSVGQKQTNCVYLTDTINLLRTVLFDFIKRIDIMT